MEIYNKEVNNKSEAGCILVLNKKEAQQLVDIIDTAVLANKKKRVFKTWKKQIDEKLACF